MQIDASRWARKRIRDCGGKLYIWFTPVKMSDDYLKQRVSTTKPVRVEFTRFEADRFAVFFDAKQAPPEVLTVRFLWPAWLRVSGAGTGSVSFAIGGDGG